MGWLYDTGMNLNSGRHEYEILVRGHLDQLWHAWFEGWTITELESGETLLTSALIDQAAVHAVLNRIRDINLTLLSVKRKK